VVESKGSRKLYDELGTEKKEYVLLNYENHIIVCGEDAGRVHRIIAEFIEDIVA
jgi:esterase/lipase